jgi:ATP-dependent DNA ligase
LRRNLPAGFGRRRRGKALDWTARLPAIAAGAALLRGRSFTRDGEAAVIRPDGLTDFEVLR